MTALIPLFRKAFRFLQRNYVNDSTSRFYNPRLKRIDTRLIKSSAKKSLNHYLLEHYLHVSTEQITHMTRDEYMLACSQAGLIERHKIKIMSIAHEAAIARAVNTMFGKRK